MKIIHTFYLFIIFSSIAFSCKKANEPEPEPIPNVNVIVKSTNVKTLQVCDLIIREPFTDKYSGTFGNVSIDLVKTNDTTLSFVVPDITEGDVYLKFALSTQKFTVSKTAEIPITQLLTTINSNFDLQIKSIIPANATELAQLAAIKQYKQDVINLINSLPDNKKREVMLFYEANKAFFLSYVSNTFGNLDGTTKLGGQSTCPRTDFYSFYSCTANNLGLAAVDLLQVSKEFAKYAALTGVIAWVAPAAVGLYASTTVYATYLFMTNVLPAAKHFVNSSLPFLEANWIFSKALFLSVVAVYQDQTFTDLNLLPKFRSLSSTDGLINPACDFFIKSYNSVSQTWNRLPSIFGSLPIFKTKDTAASLITSDISIVNISNPNVQLLSRNNQSVQFKTISGKEESFTYTLQVSKQGFTESTTVSGKVMPGIDSTNIYKAACVGGWTVKGYDPNNPTSTYIFQLAADGTGAYQLSGKQYPIKWSIQKSGNEYRMYETGFWHPAYDALKRDKLTYPITMFKTYALFDPNYVSQEYFKN